MKMLRAIPFTLPFFITVSFILTANTPFLWITPILLVVLHFFRNLFGKFTLSELVSTYQFFHHQKGMQIYKLVMGLFYITFNIWVGWFLLSYPITWLRLVVFIYCVIIINSNFAISLAHDLMHAESRYNRLIGNILLLQNGFFYLEPDHLYIHHRFVGTGSDPATAKNGENIYSYLLRSISSRMKILFFRNHILPASKQDNIILNTKLRATACLIYLSSCFFINKYFFCVVLFQFVFVVLIYESITYIQHYGLKRSVDSTGHYFPIALNHSWNCYYKLSSYLYFMMPVHSVHHIQHPDLNSIKNWAGPSMPLPFAHMLLAAYQPSHWFKLMNERAIHYNTLNEV